MPQVGLPAFKAGSGAMAFHAVSQQPIYVGMRLDDPPAPPSIPNPVSGFVRVLVLWQFSAKNGYMAYGYYADTGGAGAVVVMVPRSSNGNYLLTHMAYTWLGQNEYLPTDGFGWRSFGGDIRLQNWSSVRVEANFDMGGYSYYPDYQFFSGANGTGSMGRSMAFWNVTFQLLDEV